MRECTLVMDQYRYYNSFKKLLKNCFDNHILFNFTKQVISRLNYVSNCALFLLQLFYTEVVSDGRFTYFISEVACDSFRNYSCLNRGTKLFGQRERWQAFSLNQSYTSYSSNCMLQSRKLPYISFIVDRWMIAYFVRRW